MEQLVKVNSGKISTSLKWSTLGEVISKITVPLANMVLARILVPEIFGIAASVSIIVSFCEMFAESGFSKYIIQKDFETEDHYKKTLSVSFWTNLFISFILLAIVIIFKDFISNIVGCSGYENVLLISSIQIPLYAVSSIQTAILRRNFEFKKLFIVRIVTSLIPLVVTLPLAFFGFSVWSLVIGSICTSATTVLLLLFVSSWKPTFFYSFKIFKEMFSYSSLVLIESIIIWFCTWADIIIISQFFTPTEVGIYKTSLTMITSLYAIITASVIPVLYSGLSRYKNDDAKFKDLFCKMQKIMAIVIFPAGVGIFIYRSFATDIMFGSGWELAESAIGILGIGMIFTTCFSYLVSEVFRAKGKPQISVAFQLLMFVLATSISVSLSFIGYEYFIYGVLVTKILYCLISLAFLKIFFGFNIIKIIKNLFPIIICTIIMGCFGFVFFFFNSSLLGTMVGIINCITIYFGVFYVFWPNYFDDLAQFLKNGKKRGKE